LRDYLIAPGRIIYSLEARRKFARLLDDFKPDIIHIHNIYHHISPSILSAAKKRGIPVVMHLHDYKLVCPIHQLFTEDKVCERCLGGHYYECSKHRCFNGSLAKSLLLSAEMYIHHDFLKIYENNISRFIAPSAFMKETVVRFGSPANKVEILYNFADSTERKNNPLPSASDYFLYFGRLSVEKGLKLLLAAWKEAKLPYRLLLAGSGPQEAELKSLASELGINDSVSFLGRLEGQELSGLVSASRTVIIPSLWYENMPLSLLEAIQSGRPIIASKRGGLPEVVKEGKTGWLFNPEDVSALAAALKANAASDIDAYGLEAKHESLRFGIKEHLEKLLAIYKELI
jgi:glycosyltransferase involved in cell wall biosynthesis